MEQTGPDDGAMTDLGPADHSAPPGTLTRIAYAIGGFGLLGATAADSIAVAGRHTGIHLLGSIELVQACVVLLAGSAMLIATQVGEHASVHIVTERLAKPTAARLARIASLIAGLVFMLIALMGGAAALSLSGVLLPVGHVIAGTIWTLFHILVITLQAFIFMMLSLIYLGQAHNAH